jgi:tripartite-type tricarboxylate transporter receptor subunit TctC
MQHALVPGLPALAERGFDAFDRTGWTVLAAPRGLPAPLVEALNAAVREALSDPELHDRLVQAGLDPAPPASPEEVEAFVAEEAAEYRALLAQGTLSLE